MKKKLFLLLLFLFYLLFLCWPLETNAQKDAQSIKDVNLFLNMAAGYMSLGLINDSLDILTRLRASFPENLDVLLYKGIALCMNKDYESGLKDFKKIDNYLESRKRIGGPGSLRDVSGEFAYMAMQREKGVFSPKNEGLLHFWKGIALLSPKEEKKAAVKELLSSMKKGYEDINVHYLLVYGYLKFREYKEADKELNRIWEKKEKEEIDYFLKGYLAYQRNQIKEAIAFFQKSLEIKADFAEAKKNLACLYYNRGEWEIAIQLWKSVVELNSEDFESRLNIGRAYLHMGNYEEAKKAFASLNLSIPDERVIPKKFSLVLINAERWFKLNVRDTINLAYLLKDGVDIQKIRQMGIKPYMFFLLLNEQALFQLRSKGRIEEAIEILNLATPLENIPFYILYNLGMLHYLQGNLLKAEEYGSLTVQQKDDFLDAHDLMGNVYFREARYEEALAEFKRVIEISDFDPQGHYNLGCVYWALNEWDKAEEEWKKVLISEREKTEVEKEEKFSVEGLNVSMLVRRRPVAYRAHISLGTLFEKKGMIEEAISEYEHAVGVNPFDPEAYFELGRIYFEKKSKEKAIFYLQKHLDLGGHNQEKAREMLNSLKGFEFISS